MIIISIMCATLFALGLLAFFFDWSKLRQPKPHDDFARRMSQVEFDTKQALAEMRATIDTLRRDMLGYADDARRAALRVTNELEDKRVYFDMALQRAENERSKTMQDAADMMSRRR